MIKKRNLKILEILITLLLSILKLRLYVYIVINVFCPEFTLSKIRRKNTLTIKTDSLDFFFFIYAFPRLALGGRGIKWWSVTRLKTV